MKLYIHVRTSSVKATKSMVKDDHYIGLHDLFPLKFSILHDLVLSMDRWNKHQFMDWRSSCCTNDYPYATTVTELYSILLKVLPVRSELACPIYSRPRPLLCVQYTYTRKNTPLCSLFYKNSLIMLEICSPNYCTTVRSLHRNYWNMLKYALQE